MTSPPSRSQRFLTSLPLTLALAGVAGVWLAGAVWSFEEQTRLARKKLFEVPWLLPVVLDGLAVSLAGVAYSAALDGRPALGARLGTAAAVAASAGSNAAGAWIRTSGDGTAVTLAAGVPIAANVAFEVLLGEIRRQVQRRRGLPAPAAIPPPRVLRFLMSPVRATREWRALVLAVTAPSVPVPAGAPVPAPVPAPASEYGEPSAPGTAPPGPPPSGAPSEPETHPEGGGLRPPEYTPPVSEWSAAPLTDQQILEALRAEKVLPSIRTLRARYSIGQQRATRILDQLSEPSPVVHLHPPSRSALHTSELPPPEDPIEHTPMQQS